MSTVVHPVGPEQPRTYWARRLALFVIGVVVLVAIIVFIKVLVSGPSTPAAGSSPSPTAVAATTAPCADADLVVTTKASERNYPAGVNPEFTITVQNKGKTACSVDMGEAGRTILITSGKDRIWSSRDCAVNPASDVQTIDPSATAEATVTWSRIRSADKCPSGLPTPKPGTYHVVTSVGKAQSEDTVFALQ